MDIIQKIEAANAEINNLPKEQVFKKMDSVLERYDIKLEDLFWYDKKYVRKTKKEKKD